MLIKQIADFLKVGKFTSTLLYKYDQNAKKFQYFVPTPENNFNLLLLCHTKQGVRFGAVSSGYGNKSKALAFNLTTQTTFPSLETCSVAIRYDASMLIVGNGEIKLRNNYGCDIMVTSGIFGARAFKW